MAYDKENIFAKILRGEIPSTPVHEDDTTLAFPDIAPRVKSHHLVIPKGAYSDLDDLAENASDKEIADWVRALAKVARDQGLADGGYRVIVNCGPDGGQEVPHLHGHVLGGGRLGRMISNG